MSVFARLAIVAVAVAVAIGGAAFVLSPNNNVGPPSPTVAPSPASPSPSAGAGVQPDTRGWVVYTSNRYGFDISHPADWTERPATGDWTMAEDWTNFLSSHAEAFRSPDFTNYVSAFAVDVPEAQSGSAWINDFVAASSNNCDRSRPSTTESGTVDGQPATIIDSCEDSMAFVPIGDRMHVFAVWQGSQQALLRAMLSTVRFRSPGASPSPS